MNFGKIKIIKDYTVQIIRNELWKDKNYKRLYGTKIGRSRKPIYTKDQVDKIKEEYLKGMNQRNLAKKYNLSKGTIYLILHDKVQNLESNKYD